MIVELSHNILDAFNSGCIPAIENTLKFFVQSKWSNTEDVYNKFCKEIQKFRDGNKSDEDFWEKM